MEERNVNWRKASYSADGGGNCVEVGQAAGTIGVRDTKQAHLGEGRTTLRLTREDFRRFTATLK